MRHLKVFIPLTVALMVSMTANGKTLYEKITVIDVPTRIVIPDAPVRVSVPRIPKFKILRSNPHRLTHIINDNSDDNYIDDDSLITSYRREDLTKIEHTEVLPEHIRWRLFLSRQLALLKHTARFS